MTTGGRMLVPVDSEQHVCVIREYRRLLQSAMGPTGSCKAIVTEGGYMEVSSTSAALTARLELASPVCKYINNAVAGLADHGLYFGVLLTHLLEQHWQQCTPFKAKTMQMIGTLAEEVKKCLLCDKVCIKLDFDSIQNFLPLVRTIITSKCPVYLSGIDVERLCVEITKVFLKCIDEETNMINKVYVKVENGSNVFTSYEGLLYAVNEGPDVDIAKELTGGVKILVFVLKLEDSDELFSVVDKVKQILEVAINSGVKIIACQKTVAHEIKLFLRRKKTVLLDRMGSELTKMLVNISQAFPVSQIDIKEQEITKLTGYLSSVRTVQFGDCNYLVLHNENVPIGTLLVQTFSLLGEDFIKTLILQALTALRTVAVHPMVTLGGGCLEAWIIGQIHGLKEDRKEKEFCLVSTWLQRAMQSLCTADEMDTVYHHAWKEGEAFCGCGLVGRGDVERDSGSWLTLREVVSSPVRLQAARRPDTTLRPDVLVEPHQQKLQVICSAFETFANLSDIGLILYEDEN